MLAAPAATVAAAVPATIAPAMPAAVALAGQRGLPSQPKGGVVAGEAGRQRDQGQRRTASKKQADRGRAGSQS
jgi:hypothetical protein